MPFKRTGKTSLLYLEKAEIDALLSAPDEHAKHGLRDRALLLFLYNTGARATEAAAVRIVDINGDSNRGGIAVLHGKGSKNRRVPLWGKTFAALIPLIHGRAATEPVFLNRYGEPITRFGIYALVKRHAATAGKQIPSLTMKRVRPHTIRHTTATHLLRAGVDINTIRGWLGHVSIDTTNVYAEVDMEMKTKALAACEPQSGAQSKRWRTEPAVMDFLRSL